MSAAPRKFRFLGQIERTLDPIRLADNGRKAEALGYSVLVVSDHLVLQLGALSALASLAAATSSLRIGSLVLNNDLRHPAVLAQELASLDLLSSGRLEIGIGAGWNDEEYRATGVPFDSPRIRIERLAEAVHVLKGCFGAKPFTFRGQHYSISQLDGQPKPLQKPYPPLLIAGGGPRVLRLAAEEADTVALAPLPPMPGGGATFDASESAVARQIDWIREASGDRFDDLEINIHPAMGPVALTDSPRSFAQDLLPRLPARFGRQSADDLLASPFSLIGSLDTLVEKIQRLRTLYGISSFHLGIVGDLAPVVARLAGQ